jgi:hypothetical protein
VHYSYPFMFHIILLGMGVGRGVLDPGLAQFFFFFKIFKLNIFFQ